MSSQSRTDSTSSTSTADQRQIVDGEGIAVGAESVVNITQVPDESYELSGEVVQILGDVTRQSLSQSQADSKEVLQNLVKLGIPAIAIAFIMTRKP